MTHLILLVSLFFSGWLIRKDIAEREGLSSAIWIPTLWAGILISRPLSMWLHFGGGEDSLEGSPLDRLFYFGMILAALKVLAGRRVVWSQIIAGNWAIFLFYAYLLLSISWAPSPFVSFKRWFKEFGNIFIALIVLTEPNPQQALRAIFVRCAYLFMPLSIVFLRYFPELGRRYSRGGGLEVTGVTTQKNSLGILVLICGLMLLWDWFERHDHAPMHRRKIEKYLPAAFFAIGAYLLYQCDSVTSILCLVLCCGILAVSRLPVLKQRLGLVAPLAVALALGFFVLDSSFGLKETLLNSVGRDDSLTGRKDVWAVLLDLKTDPLIGTGFCSFWSNPYYLSKLPYWVAASAHDGYLETYIDGGYIGLFFLGVMLLATGLRLAVFLPVGSNYGLVRFAIYAAILLGSVSESHFGRMSPLGFVFLLTAIGHAETAEAPKNCDECASSEDDVESGAFGVDQPLAS